MYCDLHTHSLASDGTETPTEVVRLARHAKLAAFALTDHDTFGGIEEALDAGRKQGIRVVVGTELSLPHDSGSFHLIALGVDPDNPEIKSVAGRLCEARGPRNAGMITKLQELGVDITMDEVEAEAGGADQVVARPHIAAVMMRKRVVGTFQEAFDKYLGRGAAAYVERVRVSLDDCVSATRAAGGVTVICHPFTLGFRVPGEPIDEQRFVTWCRAMADRGVDAMEARYGSYSKKQEQFFTQVTEGAGMLPSGGSDFHGSIKPAVRIGRGRGRLRVPIEWLDALIERGKSRPDERPAAD
jgi:predicted metal-dependent phosphoesterase TrpH